MLPLGHSAFSYLIAQIPRLKGNPLSIKETALLVLAGNLIDLDLIYLPLFFGVTSVSHHYLPSHTPLGALPILLLLFLLFGKSFPKRVWFYVGLALLGHLMMDDISYWLTEIGLVHGCRPQIFWLYPLDPRYVRELTWAKSVFLDNPPTRLQVLYGYLTKATAVFILELIYAGIAIVIFIKHDLRRISKSFWISSRLYHNGESLCHLERSPDEDGTKSRDLYT